MRILPRFVLPLVRSLILPLGLCLTVSSATAAPLSLGAISAYLNALVSVKGSFTQINDDGTIATGTIYISRPGKIRFEYDPPNDALVMAGGGQVAIFDPKSNLPPEQYPLKRTPLNLILKRNVDLERADMVVGHDSNDTATFVTAQDPDHPDYGTIRLVFSGPPVELRQWVITGGDGAKTTVILGDIAEGVRLPPILFSIPAEVDRRGL